MEYFILLVIGVATAAIGALPFGLVNLTVLNVYFETGSRKAFRIAHGASVIEVIFGLTAILAGGLLFPYVEGNLIFSLVIMGVLLAGGIFFLLKKQREIYARETTDSGFWKGVFLNLISVQVFLFWILAIAFLSSRQLLRLDLVSVLMFAAGIWLGKMSVLWLYINLGQKMLSKSKVISNNINKIIGFVLFGMAIVQAIKM